MREWPFDNSLKKNLLSLRMKNKVKRRMRESEFLLFL